MVLEKKYFVLKTGVFRGGCLTGPTHSAVMLHGFLSYLVKCCMTEKEYTIFGYKECKNPIQYVMEFERLYLDTGGESKEIWGIQYKYIIEGRNCRQLKIPFDIRNYQVTKKEYGPGGPFVYVETEDARAIQQHGLLETV